jgi:hypothetical protein
MSDYHLEEAEDDFKRQKAASMRLAMATLMLGPPKLNEREALAKVQEIDANQADARGQPALHVEDEDEDGEQFFAPGCEYPEMPKDEDLRKRIHAVAAKLTDKFDDDQVVLG